ncbi:MAG TPA: HAMP domain-containing sensor histidine kinase, partial [Oligoflexia bacterium]|nr:HAMP domain-containing sensor histidine kinase [Oligoflexia bacterium]
MAKKITYSNLILFASFFSLFLADTTYNYLLLQKIEHHLVLRRLSEVAYTIFAAGAALTIGILTTRNRPSVGFTILSFGLIALHAIFSHKYILHPFYSRPISPELFHLVNSTAYSYLLSIAFGLASVLALQVKSVSGFLTLNSFLLLVIGDFAIRFHSAVENSLVFIWADYAWNVSIAAGAGCALYYVKIRPRNFNLEFTAMKSVRTALALAIFVTNILLLCGISLLKIYSMPTALEFTSAIFLAFLIWLLSNSISLRVSSVFENVASIVYQQASITSNSQSLTALVPITKKTNLKETDILVNGYNQLIQHANALNLQIIEATKNRALVEIATQVAHDIRSPLAALDATLPTLTQLESDDTKILLKSATNRIRDIANMLLAKNREIKQLQPSLQNASETRLQPNLIITSLQQILSEKRTQVRNLPGVTIEFSSDAGTQAVFSKFERFAFKRVLSNLIDNAIEAKSQRDLLVEVSLSCSATQAFIAVKDNGRGIPPEVLARLGESGLSFGKVNGNGLGVHHAKATIESWGGSLSFESQEDNGTTTTVTIPLCEKPDIFEIKLKLNPDLYIVIIDDDHAVHELWRQKIASSNVPENHITTFLSADSFYGYFRNGRNKLS